MRSLLECRGRVEPGRKLGRILGAPTANLALPPNAGVPCGTYAALVDGAGHRRAAVAHVGVRPSVAVGGAPLLEVHLLDFDGDLYGRELVVTLVDWVAGEATLDSLDALAGKIARDVALVRAYFAAASVAARSAHSRWSTARRRRLRRAPRAAGYQQATTRWRWRSSLRARSGGGPSKLGIQSRRWPLTVRPGRVRSLSARTSSIITWGFQ